MNDSTARGAAASPLPQPDPDDVVRDLAPPITRVPYVLAKANDVISDDVAGKRPGASRLAPVPTTAVAIMFGALAPVSMITHADGWAQAISVGGFAIFSYLALVSISAWWHRRTRSTLTTSDRA